jgi:hypothetical protein
MGKNWLSLLQSGIASKDTLLLASEEASRHTIVKQLMSTSKSKQDDYHETVIKTSPKINTDIV